LCPCRLYDVLCPCSVVLCPCMLQVVLYNATPQVASMPFVLLGQYLTICKALAASWFQEAGVQLSSAALGVRVMQHV
jgi:hypothetical protein